MQYVEKLRATVESLLFITNEPLTSSQIAELAEIEEDDVLDVLEYYNGQKKGTSYAFIGYDAGGKEIWKTTFVPTPGEPNNYQEFRTCE